MPPTPLLSVIDGLLAERSAPTNKDASITPTSLRDLLPEVDPKCIDEAVEKLYNFPWTHEQSAAIELILNPPRSMATVSGPVGSGKTELLVWFFRLCFEIKVKVIVIADRNGILDAILSKLVNTFPELPLPLRVYSYRSQNLFSNYRSDSDYTIEAAVMRNIKNTSGPLRGSYPQTIQVVDFRAEFQRYRQELQKYPISDRKHWDNARERRLRHAYHRLREEVIRNAWIAFLTPAAAIQDEFGNNFARNPRDKIVLAAEESHLISTQDVRTILRQASSPSKFILSVMMGDTKQLGLRSLTGRGTSDFGVELKQQPPESLFSRLIEADHPYVELKMQTRQHRALYALVNQRFHDLSTKSVLKKQMADLTEHKDMISSIFRMNAELRRTQTDQQRRMHYFEVTNGITLKSSNSMSLANPGYAYYVTKTILPQIREAFGHHVRNMVKILTPYRSQVDLYNDLMANMRREGWAEDELPQAFTIDAIAGDQAYLTIFDLVVDEDQDILADEYLCNVAFSRAQEMSLVIGGSLRNVPTSSSRRRVADVSSNNEWVEVEIFDSPILHAKKYFIEADCHATVDAPEHTVPGDLIPLDNNCRRGLDPA